MGKPNFNAYNKPRGIDYAAIANALKEIGGKAGVSEEEQDLHISGTIEKMKERT
jgi:hypothetical protein